VTCEKIGSMIHSTRDLLAVKEMEEEERARRIKEEQVLVTCDRIDTMIQSTRDKITRRRDGRREQEEEEEELEEVLG